MAVTDESGRTYELSDRDVQRLRSATTAREADHVFDTADCDVPPMSRADVWKAV